MGLLVGHGPGGRFTVSEIHPLAIFCRSAASEEREKQKRAGSGLRAAKPGAIVLKPRRTAPEEDPIPSDLRLKRPRSGPGHPLVKRGTVIQQISGQMTWLTSCGPLLVSSDASARLRAIYRQIQTAVEGHQRAGVRLGKQYARALSLSVKGSTLPKPTSEGECRGVQTDVHRLHAFFSKS